MTRFTHKGELGRRAVNQVVYYMEEGTIVKIDYDLYNAENDALIETTREETAKENDLHKEGQKYIPMTIVVGAGQLIEGFEESLLDAKANKDIELEISPEKAYGERKSEDVETYGMEKMMRFVRDPESLAIGSSVEINGRTGILKYVAAGRARVDYNHPLAGQTLKYNYKIVEVIKGKNDKANAILESQTGHKGFGVKFKGNDLTVELPQEMLYDPNASMLKFRVVGSLRDGVGAEKVTFTEVHEPRTISEEEE
ncbi:MAG: peptidylprolyl isomerase [Euryarchaeota archaeon]|nr:peptidylprolyl isomerase [Euryarchaeota archaeon]